MKTVIYLVADRSGVRRMTKSLPSIYRGEIPIKVAVTIEDTAFRTPVIEKSIVIDDWREGIDMADVEFKKDIITAEEADIIRRKRLEKMREILTDNGFTVVKQPEDEGGE